MIGVVVLYVALVVVAIAICKVASDEEHRD